MNEQELLELKEEIDQAKQKYSELKGRLTFLMKQLKEDQGCTTIEQAEKKSAETCEQCGEPGSMDNSQYWLLTLCGACKTKRAEGESPWNSNG